MEIWEFPNVRSVANEVQKRYYNKNEEKIKMRQRVKRQFPEEKRKVKEYRKIHKRKNTNEGKRMENST